MPLPRRVALAIEIHEPYPHHQDLFAGILRFASEHPGWRLEIDQYPTFACRRRGLPERPYDGVIARTWPALERRLNKLGIPLVNTHFQSSHPGLPGVYHDPVQVSKLAAEHLMQRGCKRFGVVWDPDLRHAKAVATAFIQHITAEGYRCDKLPIMGENANDLQSWVTFETNMKRWLATLQPPVGLFIDSAFSARMAATYCRAMGLHVPQDVSIVCEHDLKSIVEVSPQITTIHDNYEVIGYEAAALLQHLMDGQPPPTEPILIGPRSITARESTDYYAVEDDLVSKTLQYISANLRAKLDLPEIAFAMAVSVSTLQKRFHAALGRSVGQETRRLRLSTVKVMLAEPERTIESIARDTGFASAVVLNHVFKRELGQTPTEFRQQILADR